MKPAILTICFGLFLVSIGFNILLWNSNQKLIYQIHRLETGPAKGLFNKIEPDHSIIGDEEQSRIISDLLRQMIEDQQRNNTT